MMMLNSVKEIIRIHGAESVRSAVGRIGGKGISGSDVRRRMTEGFQYIVRFLKALRHSRKGGGYRSASNGIPIRIMDLGNQF